MARAWLVLWFVAGCRQLFGIDSPVLGDASTDASADVAAVSCPASYVTALAGLPSRYRIIATHDIFRVQNAACSADMPGSTHLVSLDSIIEQGELANLLQQVGSPSDRYYIGAVQQPAETSVAAGWFAFNGEPVLAGAWSGSQPDDGDSVEDGAEQLAVVAIALGLQDDSGTTSLPAVCECDGRPIDPTVASFLPN
jgi:hypothetical protein